MFWIQVNHSVPENLITTESWRNMAYCLLVQTHLILYIQPICIWLSWTAQWKCAESRYHFAWDLWRLFGILNILNPPKKFKLEHYWNYSTNIVYHRIQHRQTVLRWLLSWGLPDVTALTGHLQLLRLAGTDSSEDFLSCPLAIFQIWSVGAVSKPKWITQWRKADCSWGRTFLALNDRHVYHFEDGSESCVHCLVSVMAICQCFILIFVKFFR